MKLNLIGFFLVLSAIWVESLRSTDLCWKKECNNEESCGKVTCRGKHNIQCSLKHCSTNSIRCQEFLDFSYYIQSFKPMSINATI